MTAPVLHTAVLDELGTAIIGGEHAAGEVLTLEQLQQHFGVSRTVMREVMRILESMNLVRSRRRVGVVVMPMRDWNVFDARVIRWRLGGPGRTAQLRSLTELRLAVEPVAAAGAAQNAGRAERDRLAEVAGQLREHGEAGRLEQFLEADIAFHTIVLTSSGNEMFTALTEVVAEVLRGRTQHGLMPDVPTPVALAAHDEVARAVAGSDTHNAETAMHLLLAEVRTALGR